MKSLLVLMLFSLPLAADTAPKCDKSPNCPVCKQKKEQVAMGGARYDNRIENGVDRAADEGNTEREQQLENQEEKADLQQVERQADETIRSDGRR